MPKRCGCGITNILLLLVDDAPLEDNLGLATSDFPQRGGRGDAHILRGIVLKNVHQGRNGARITKPA
jgi:hypothetical protein